MAVAGLQFGCGAPQKAPGAQGGPSPESRTARALASVRDDRAELERFLATFPVGGDLHHHLGGSVPVEHLIRMATDRGLCLPRSEDTVWALVAPAAGGCPAGARPVAEAAVDETFRAEIEGRWTMRKYLSNAPSVDRQAANDHFFDSFGKFTPALGDFPRTLAVVRNAAAAQGTLYIETSTGGRAGPALGLAVEAVRWSEDFGALRERLLESAEFQRARERSVDAFATVLERSEEILGCETPAAQPGCDVFVRLQVHAMRTSSPLSVFAQTLLSYEVSSRLPEVVGINLVAPEHDPVSVRDYDLHMKMHATLGPLYPDVGRALHAAEFSEDQARRLGTTDHLEKALSVARAQRIGHGVSLDAEQRRAWVLETLRERGVAVELNLRSNEELLGVLGRDHPLPDYLAAGVPIVLSTDDAGLMLTTQREQFRLALQYPEVGYAELKRFAYNSLRYSFLADGDEERLVRRLDAQFREFEGRF
ncbi:MAG: hypothetical protein AAGK22_19175 [Acidobacteriota bacterium]